MSVSCTTERRRQTRRIAGDEIRIAVSAVLSLPLLVVKTRLWLPGSFCGSNRRSGVKNARPKSRNRNFESFLSVTAFSARVKAVTQLEARVYRPARPPSCSVWMRAAATAAGRAAGVSGTGTECLLTCMGVFLSSGFLVCCGSLFGAERPFLVPSPAIRFAERAEGVKGPKC